MSRKRKRFIGVSTALTVSGLVFLSVGEDQSASERSEGLIDRIIASAPGILVSYGSDYDFAQILSGLRPEALSALWEEGEIHWRGRYVGMKPGKYLDLGIAGNPGSRRRIYDIEGFFVKRLNEALREWGECPDNCDVTGLSRSEMEEKPDIGANLLRARLIARLAETLRAATDEVGLTPSLWCGPGSIASKLLQKVEFKKTLAWDEWPDGVKVAAEAANFGGRMEIYRQGPFERLWQADINSAYPAEMIKLPRLNVGTWKREIDLTKEGMTLIEWRVMDPSLIDAGIAPFPQRDGEDLAYCRSGRGWYHNVEIRAAVRSGVKWRGLDGWTFQPFWLNRPLECLSDLYAQRKKYAADGEGSRSMAIKLAMNAVYGKLAQRVTNDRFPPTYRNPYLAGRVTAGVRAKAMGLMRANLDSLVQVSTDGITCCRPICGYKSSTRLGEWSDAGSYDRCCVLGPGIVIAEDGERNRTRGFQDGIVSYGDALDAWNDHSSLGSVSFDERRFIGIGECVGKGDFTDFRRFETERVTVSYTEQSFRMPSEDDPSRLGFGCELSMNEV